MNTYIGIDPGKMGAVAVLDYTKVSGCDLTLTPVPVKGKEYDIFGMANLLALIKQNSGNSCTCVIERSQAMPGQGVCSMFNYGVGYGLWLGILTTVGIPYVTVHPRTWTKEIFKGVENAGKGKERSMMVARTLFPEWKPKYKKEWQYGDAILLAEYARRLDGNKL
jgi:crossover junction endodeoxyribonuclease RuvC